MLFWSAYGGRESKFSEGTVLLWFVSARMAFGGPKKIKNMHSRLQHAKVFYEEKKIKKCFLSKTMISYKKVLLLLFWQKFGRT